ncbi:protein tyrosine phosphatase 10D isoform X3 [Lycorma delicatula]|uniref:protein tyrosine phosphatase 10D isoform X3 n=1 Tax=Lycorma delicatula TaxID=130591 RepID=UPI003F514FEB
MRNLGSLYFSVLRYVTNSRYVIFITLLLEVCFAADLVIEIPSKLLDNNSYRFDYSPPYGSPPPNTTIASRDIGDKIQFSNGLPGTKYDFYLYNNNSSIHDGATWTASIITDPDPPSNLSVSVRSGKVAHVSWSPPALGHYTGFKMKVVALAESVEPRTITLAENASPYILRELTPGGTYQVQLFTVYDNKESPAYISRNFTTKPNTPGKFIVWFRNETTLLVLWQPSYPASIYTHYKVSIEPQDSPESVLYVEKDGEPPGPAQAAFKGLIPGRAYNISVQTVSDSEVSPPTKAQYRTIPLRPYMFTYDKASVTSHSFKVTWEPPKGVSEFDKYQVMINSPRRPGPLIPIMRNRDEPTEWEFHENLVPGQTYSVLGKTVSGKVTSWPATVNVTLKPLPVQELTSVIDDHTGDVTVTWVPDNSSIQEVFKVSYSEVEIVNGDSNTVYASENKQVLESLLPGRNYSITVQAISNQMESNETVIYQATRPSSPIIEDLKPIEFGLNISWKSDVNSRQDKFEVIHNRNDTGVTDDVEAVTTMTTDERLTLTHLYPGAGYQIKVFAISHGLRSEPHDYFQAVFPRPPTNLTIEKVTSNSVVVRWKEPDNSLFSEYSIRYKTEEDDTWVKLPPVRGHTESEVTDMTPGERYTIQVNTVSFGVESNHPQQVNHTIRPNPVSSIAPLVDSTNVTLEFPRPEGRIEWYIISWAVVEGDEEIVKTKNMTGGGSDDGKPVRALIEDLMPGVKYRFEIHTVSYGLESDITPLTTRTMPLILSEVLVVNNQQATDSVTLRYTPTPQTSSHFDLYRFSLSDPSTPIKEKLANDTEWKVTFNGLTPGRLYNITVWTVSDGVLSQPLQRQDRLYPEPITGINATSITDTAITLIWDTPKGEFNAFEVQYLNTEGLLIQNLTLHDSITIGDLKPHRNYTFTVVVRSGTESSVLRRSLPVSAIFTTQESVPGKVEKFHPVDVLPGDISFEWTLPGNEQNGVIRKFTITYGLEGSTHIQVRDFKPWELHGTIKNLIPGKSYIFRIQAETRIGYGPEAIWKQKMPILAPPPPSSQVVPTEVCRTSTTIQIRFRKNYFSEQNGAVIAYTIIVAEDDSKNASSLEMPSWRDVQAYSIWPPYQVMEPYYPFKNSSVEDFTVGEESCEGHAVGYCNGPLKSGSTYRVKIRAFTTPEKFTDTYYSFPIQTDQDNTPLMVGLAVPLALLFVLVVIILVLRRRRYAAKNATENRASDTLSLPDSVMETSRPIPLDKFAEHYRIMSADSDFRFSEEFEELKHVGREQPCSAADLPCNRPKNRFTNILPYDHSRFKLQPVDDEEGSDYINANYVSGYNSPREFIVTQGPLHSTKDDFWRMCWESNSRAIVMLTRCIEKGREKCDHYWPYDTLPVYYGDISVTMLNDSHYPDWTITEFIMCRGDQQRVIRHFHFTTWPDFGVPSPPQTLVRFVRAFRERVGADQRPIVVHCSAGVGRSGTLIALDRILQQINHSDHVDIFGIVYAMRKERVWMVQTEQQYICIHQCLLAVLEGNEVQGPPREIHHNQGFEGWCNRSHSKTIYGSPKTNVSRAFNLTAR